MYSLIVVWLVVINGSLERVDLTEVQRGLTYQTCVAMSIELQKQVKGDGGTAGCLAEI